MAASDPQTLDTRLELRVRVERLHGFITFATDFAGVENHQRHAVVDAGDRHAVDHVTHPAGRQQARADGARRVEEVDDHGRRGAWHAVNARLPFVGDDPARCAHRDVTLHAGIQRQHPQRGRLALRLDHARFQGEGHDGGQHVAAIGRGVHLVRVRLQLGEQEIEVDTRLGTRADDADLAGQRMRPAQPIDLPAVRRPQGGQQDAVAQGCVAGKIAGPEERATRGATAHQQAWNRSLHRHHLASKTCSPEGIAEMDSVFCGGASQGAQAASSYRTLLYRSGRPCEG
jgi:hypothetical protein